jgi:hypothetical protein
MCLIGSDRLSSNLVSDYFLFWIISEGFGQILDHLVSDHFGFSIVSDWIRSDIGSSIVESFLIWDQLSLVERVKFIL